jgi:hypothetical protein
MTVQWEYLTIRWHAERIPPKDPNDQFAEWTVKHIVEIRWPSSADYEHVSTETLTWRQGETKWKKVKKADPDLHVLCNELGADGWECFSINTFSSGALNPQNSFLATSHPLDVNYSFKRKKDG